MNARKENPHPPSPSAEGKLEIRLATDADRKRIYASRHDVYAVELSQHPTNGRGMLTNDLDAFNVYIIGQMGDELIGYVSITPPGEARYSLDSYLPREEWPIEPSDTLYEVRLLTVVPAHRGRTLSAALMYGALRYIQARGGTHIMATGRQEVASIYRRVGLKEHGISIQSGQVTYLLMSAPIGDIVKEVEAMGPFVERLRRSVDWQMGIPFEYVTDK